MVPFSTQINNRYVFNTAYEDRWMSVDVKEQNILRILFLMGVCFGSLAAADKRIQSVRFLVSRH